MKNLACHGVTKVCIQSLPKYGWRRLRNLWEVKEEEEALILAIKTLINVTTLTELGYVSIICKLNKSLKETQITYFE